jgi:hypothetical protein
LGGVPVYEILRVDLADEVLLEDLVDVFVPMDREDVLLSVSKRPIDQRCICPRTYPVRLDTAAHGAENHIATRMVRDPVRDVVDTIAAVNPVAFRLAIVLVNLVKSEKSVLGLVVVVFRWRFSQSVAAQ